MHMVLTQGQDTLSYKPLNCKIPSWKQNLRISTLRVNIYFHFLPGIILMFKNVMLCPTVAKNVLKKIQVLLLLLSENERLLELCKSIIRIIQILSSCQSHKCFNYEVKYREQLIKYFTCQAVKGIYKHICCFLVPASQLQ